MSRALAPHMTAPLSSGRAARSRRKSQLDYFLFGSVARLLGCLEIQNGHQRLGMERTTTSSLVPFQPFQSGRNKSRHALTATSRLASRKQTGCRSRYCRLGCPWSCRWRNVQHLLKYENHKTWVVDTVYAWLGWGWVELNQCVFFT